MNNRNNLIIFFLLVISGMIVITLAPEYYIPFYILSSLAAAFLYNYFMYPKIFRKMVIKEPRFHRSVMIIFFQYMVIGVLCYVLLG